MKKINKTSPPLRENSPSLHTLFGGQTAPSPRPCERSGQIIYIGLMVARKIWCILFVSQNFVNFPKIILVFKKIVFFRLI
jgi:hypothetical protein